MADLILCLPLTKNWTPEARRAAAAARKRKGDIGVGTVSVADYKGDIHQNTKDSLVEYMERQKKGPVGYVIDKEFEKVKGELEAHEAKSFEKAKKGLESLQKWPSRSGYEKRLTEEDAYAILSYTKFHDTTVNAQLRSKNPNARALAFENHLNRALDKLPLTKEKTVYRGATLSTERVGQYRKNIGATIRHRAFTSASRDLRRAQGFTSKEDIEEGHQRVLYHIRTKKAREIPFQLSHFPGEAESLFKSGTRFKVKMVSKPKYRDGITEIHLEEVD